MKTAHAQRTAPQRRVVSWRTPVRTRRRSGLPGFLMTPRNCQPSQPLLESGDIRPAGTLLGCKLEVWATPKGSNLRTRRGNVLLFCKAAARTWIHAALCRADHTGTHAVDYHRPFHQRNRIPGRSRFQWLHWLWIGPTPLLPYLPPSMSWATPQPNGRTVPGCRQSARVASWPLSGTGLRTCRCARNAQH